MKIFVLKKLLIIPFIGMLFLGVSSCNAQKQSEEASKETKTSEQKPVEKSSQSSTEHPIIDFTLQSISDKKISLTDFLGNKIILMNFWATWCPYCVMEIPKLNTIETTHKNQVKVLSIDILEKPEKVKKFAEQKGIKFDVLLDIKGEVAKKYGIRGTPTSIVIDKNKNFAYFGYELEKAEKVIESLLHE